MAKYKVTNLNSPIESDYWVDIPVRDPATNKDAVDEKGRILVERHVTRSVKNEEMSTINTAVETVNTLKEDYSTFKEEVSTKVNTHDSSILTNTNNITTLTDSVTNHDLQINALYTKINAIQGIDIDDFKYVTETDIKNIKENYLPLAGGTITGATTLKNNLTVTGIVTSTFKGNLTGNVTGNLTGSVNGSATSATNDSVNRSIVNTYALKSHYPDRISINWDTTFKGYVNLTVDQTTWGLITTANIAQQAVNYANTCNKANSATTAGSANTAVSCTNANHAVKADTAIVANIADKATKDSSNNIIIDTYATKSSVASVNTTATNANNNANSRVHLTTAQTITAQHNFSNGVKISGYLITIG